MKDKKRHEYWMSKAISIGKEALEMGEFPVGCILVSRDEVVGVGKRENSNGKFQNELDHAEIVALRDWVKRGKPGKDVVCYTTLEPCLMCIGALVISGIKEIVFSYEDIMGGAANIFLKRDSQKGLAELYETANIEIIKGVLRKNALSLFKKFFKSPSNEYLKDTLLARYTLSQD